MSTLSALHCPTCQVKCNTESDFKAHMDGKRHARLTKGPCQLSPTPQRTSRKRVQAQDPDASAAFDETEKDKHGVTLKGEFDFGFIESATTTASSVQVTILSTTAETINVSEIRLSSTTTWRTSPFGIEHPELPQNLTQGAEETTFSITFDPQSLLGRHDDRVEVVFQHLGLNQQFVITRSIQATVGNEADLELLKPSAPYIPQPPKKALRKQQLTEEYPLPGVKPASLVNMHWTVGLPLSPVPTSLIHVLDLDDKKEIMTILKHQWLPRIFNAKNHGRFFQILLHAEEVQMSVDLQCYDMQDVEMDYVAPFYRLSVPDLAEKRPSIIIGDRVLIQPKKESTTKVPNQWFEGFVHHIHQGEIDLQFHKSFNGEKGERYDTRFQFDRIPFRRMQQALGLSSSHSPDRLLFPSEIHIEGRTKVTELQIQGMRCVNKSIESNPQQLLAVVSIVHMPEGCVPFVVFGPPGTGKTVVIVEAILQILSSHPNSHILACATSNSAADLLVERLRNTFTPSQMFRLNAPSRAKESLSKDLKPYSRLSRGGTFCVPPLSEMKEFKIIVATCMASSILHGIGLGNRHFSYVFVDEAGQASEPEVMIPVKMLAGEKTNVILSGDPKQLGPIVRSAAAASLGLATSYLDRLMARDIYDSNIGHGISVVKLIKNWRNHPAILTFPNQQFYASELEAHGDELITHSLLKSPELVTPDFPIVFHGIIGQDMQQANSPSYFNPDEASVVRGYIERLLKDQQPGLGLEDTQIGVIAPYHAQVVKIRTLLRNSGYAGVKIGSVEEFQGQERRVIIISTVRSSVKHFDYDIRHALGFVANPRRFNVAMTRAQALLITIGNPAVLSLDPLWRGFMNYVSLNGGWRGVRPDWDTKEAVTTEADYGLVRRNMAIGELEALIERTKTLTLGEEKTGCLPQHVRGARHKQHLQKNPDWQPADVDSPTSPTIPVGFVRCDTCNLVFPSKYEASHQNSLKHRKKERFFVLHSAFEEADKDKHGVELDGDLDFGFIEYDTVNSSHQRFLDVLLTTREKVLISDVRLSSSKSNTRAISNFSLGEFALPCRVKPNTAERLTVIFNTNGHLGRFNDRVEIIFQDIALQKQFAITRPIQAVVGNSADLEFLKPSAPFKPRTRTKPVADDEDPVPGVRPPQLSEIEWAVSLPKFMPPQALQTLLLSVLNVRQLIPIIRQKWLPPPPLDVDTYTRHFRALLHIEEVQMNIDVQYYNMEDVNMDPIPSNYYRLTVPGLAEKRPSVIIGDRITVQKTNEGGDRWFEGFVHRVHQLTIDLKFHPSFKALKGQKFNVRFKVSRIPLRRMHQALATAFNPDRVLFPKQHHIQDRRPVTEDQLNSIRTVNRLIDSNHPQLRAVCTIVNMPPGSVPFVIFGPPGTGKTVTVVETIRQTLFNNPNARILACAPSNSAADLLAERLTDTFNASQLFRLNAPSRDKKALPESLLGYSLVNNEQTFSIPPIQRLQAFKIIVSTCISASVPYAIGMVRGHFSHIFVDEAGQACEPEVMIPIKTMADNETNIILSGDPKQLGPIVRSSVAASLGLKTSYLDRLMSRPIYDPQIGDGICVVKLIKNWRNHVSILKYPNEQFYKNELEPHGDQIVTHSLLRSSEIVKPGFPIVFHAIAGKDLQEASSPSFFNPDEASVVKAYVERLKSDRRFQLKNTQIGVITPYHAQVLKIRALLKKSGYEGIKVGSVEEFQGQERRVIIVSTVRSSVDQVGFDLRHTLGFVANPRRFNVAITRAQALLIVVGDPSVLSLDPLWRGFLNYIHLEGGWRGVQPDWDTSALIEGQDYAPSRRQAAESDIDGLIERTRTLILENSERLEEVDGSDDDDRGRVDRPWRETE